MTSVCLVADCLKSYDKYREINIMMRLGPTLVGEKPMHIFCFSKTFKFINQILNDVHTLFYNHPTIKYRIVYSHNNSIKIIVYNLKSMEKLLTDPRVNRFLKEQGYANTLNSEDYMTLLENALIKNQLPAEYGIFFGYPIKDVMGFIGHPALKYVKTTAWKVYGDPRPSDMIFKKFEQAEKRIFELCQIHSLNSVVSNLNAIY